MNAFFDDLHCVSVFAKVNQACVSERAKEMVRNSHVRASGFKLQILEAEGMLVPDELSCILQLVSEHLREPCPITSLSSTQGPAQHEGLTHPSGNGRKTSGRRQVQQVNTTRPEKSSLLL